VQPHALSKLWISPWLVLVILVTASADALFCESCGPRVLKILRNYLQDYEHEFESLAVVVLKSTEF